MLYFYTKDQRVITLDKGPGVVVGFERFSPSGKQMEPSDIDIEASTARVIVQLDDPTKWAFHDKGVGLPHFYRRELKPE